MEQTKWVSGDWNAVCDLCGFNFKASDLIENWKGQKVCRHDFEVRHPQDFVRPIKENTSVPWNRPEEDVSVATQTVSGGGSAIFLTASLSTTLFPIIDIIGGAAHKIVLPAANNAAFLGISVTYIIQRDPASTNDLDLSICYPNGTVVISSVSSANPSRRVQNDPVTNTWRVL